MERISIEIKHKIAHFLTLESAKNLSITSSIWRHATYSRIWNKPRFRGILLSDLKNLAHLPIHQLHTSDIIDRPINFRNLVEVLKRFQTLQLVIIDHRGYVDNIHMLKELDCKLIIYFDKLMIRNTQNIQAVIDVLKMLTPEAVYLEEEISSKDLSPSNIMTMRNINLKTLSSFHLGATYLFHPWQELQNLKTLKKLRLISGSYLIKKNLEMFEILYVHAPMLDYTSPYNQPAYNIENNKEHITVLIESLEHFRIIKYLKMDVYIVLWDIIFYIENK